MKTVEFIKKVEDLGYTVTEGYVCTDLMVVKDGRGVLTVCTKERYSVNTDLAGFKMLNEGERENLLNIAVEYVKTSVEEREVSQKYYLSLPEPLKHNLTYLNLKVGSDIYILSDKEGFKGYQTKFTQEEIDNFPNQDFIKTLIKEEA